MMSDVFWVFLTPPSPQNPILWCPFLTLRPAQWPYIQFFFSIFGTKLLSSKLIKKSVKRNFVGERKIKMHNGPHSFWKKIVKKRVKNPRIMGCPIFAKLATPPCPILSDFAWPPRPPKKIGHHSLCSLLWHLSNHLLTSEGPNCFLLYTIPQDSARNPFLLENIKCKRKWRIKKKLHPIVQWGENRFISDEVFPPFYKIYYL